MKDCVHFWAIETTQEATARGVCVLCGEVREFRNWNVRPLDEPPIFRNYPQMDRRRPVGCSDGEGAVP